MWNKGCLEITNNFTNTLVWRAIPNYTVFIRIMLNKSYLNTGYIHIIQFMKYQYSYVYIYILYIQVHRWYLCHFKKTRKTYYLTKLQTFTNPLSLKLESLPHPKPTPSMTCEVLWRKLVVMEEGIFPTISTYDDWDQQLLSTHVFQSKIVWWIKLGFFSVFFLLPTKRIHLYKGLDCCFLSSRFLFGAQSGELL